jgi:hypothetical protein
MSKGEFQRGTHYHTGDVVDFGVAGDENFAVYVGPVDDSWIALLNKDEGNQALAGYASQLRNVLKQLEAFGY